MRQYRVLTVTVMTWVNYLRSGEFFQLNSNKCVWMLVMLLYHNCSRALQMPLGAIHKKVQTSKTSAYRRQQQHTFRHCQLGHVIPGYAILVAVCLFMLPMLEVAVQHKQLTTTHHTNPADLCGGHVTFSHSHLVLASLDNMLPAMVLQNRIVWSNIHLSHSLSHSSINRHVFLSLGFNAPSCLKKVVMVVILLLLLSGDIETNPGPVGEHSNKQRWEVELEAIYSCQRASLSISWSFRKHTDLRWPWSSAGCSDGCGCTVVSPWAPAQCEKWNTGQDQSTIFWP